MSASPTSNRIRLLAIVGLFSLLTFVFWWFRIYLASSGAMVGWPNADLWVEHYPMTRYGFEMLRAGDLPLWNPYQLMGLPFLAIPHTGLLYPGNLAYAIFGPAVGSEVVWGLHSAFAAFSMWLLARHFGISSIGGVVAGLTFAWSGWMSFQVALPGLISGMSWLPLTVLLVERSLSGRRFAAMGLSLAVACQILNGATEFFVYNMYVAALFTLARLGSGFARRGPRLTFKLGGMLIVAVVAGVALSGVQLFPSLELVSLGSRTQVARPLSWYLEWGAIAPSEFVSKALSSATMVSMGFLPLVGLGFCLFDNRHRKLALFLSALALLAALLVFGGPVYELYHRTPIGQLFRRPMKLLHIYSFAMSLLAGIVVTAVERWIDERRSVGQMWRTPEWLAGIAIVLVGIAWQVGHDEVASYFVGAGLLLLGFGIVRDPRVRRVMLFSLVVIQGISLFFGISHKAVRPFADTELFDREADLFADLMTRAEHDRIFLSSRLWFFPDLTQKQGTVRRARLSTAHQPLTTLREAVFFERAAPSERELYQFIGGYEPTEQANWKLLDLTSARYYIARRGSPTDEYLGQLGPPEITSKRYRVFERDTPTPRAYFVGSARVVAGEEEVLDWIESPAFRPARDVVLEADAELSVGAFGSRARGRVPRNRVSVLRDEPERVTLEVDAPMAGFLVLTDLYYPGWRAELDSEDVMIHRANYLFRAVRVPAGRSTVEFLYEPASLRWGLASTGIAALALTIVGVRIRSSAK